MAKSLRNIVSQLERAGHRITYVSRKDGSIRITSIDGARYQANRSVGNEMARAMVGERLSERKIAQTKQQLSKIHAKQSRRKPGSKGRKTVKAPLPEDVKKALRRAQAKIRRLRKGTPSTGTVSTRIVRDIIKTDGEEVALAKIDRAVRYFEGYAYPENVDALVEYLNKFAQDLDAKKAGLADPLRKVIEKVVEKRDTFKEAWIAPIHEKRYDLTKAIFASPSSSWNAVVTAYANEMMKIMGS